LSLLGDKLTLFAGAWMLRQKQTRIQNDGCLEQLSNYQKDGQPQHVDAQWSGAAQRREVILRLHTPSSKLTIAKLAFSPIDINQFTTIIGTTSVSLNASSTSNTTYIWPALPARSTSDSPGSRITSSFTQSLYVSSSGGSSSIGQFQTTTTPSSGFPRTSGSTTDSITTSESPTKATWIDSTIPTHATSGPSNNNSLISNATSLNSFSDSSTPIPGSTSSSKITVIISVSISSTIQSVRMTTTSEIPLLATSFFHQQPTITPGIIPLLCPAFSSCVRPTPSWLESIVSAPGLYIPKITDLAVVPTQRVKQNKDDDDSLAVIFAKIELPKDTCNPLPKPKTGGLLGIVANIANKVIDAVLDAACSLEFPVIEGDYPDWLDFTKFPALKGYPPPTGPQPNDPDNPQDPSRPSVPAIPNDPQKPSPSQKESSTASSCSAKTITRCKGTAIVSAMTTRSFVTECSTETACSGTGTTSIFASTVPAPQVTDFIHPAEPIGFDLEQQCFMGLMENAVEILKDETLAACIGGPVVPIGDSSSVWTSGLTTTGTLTPFTSITSMSITAASSLTSSPTTSSADLTSAPSISSAPSSVSSAITTSSAITPPPSSSSPVLFWLCKPKYVIRLTMQQVYTSHTNASQSR
jgi:hypothetical protein